MRTVFTLILSMLSVVLFAQSIGDTIIIPTYNEKENIENIIRATFSQKKSFDILVVDDNSPDGTSTIVKKIQKQKSVLIVTCCRIFQQGHRFRGRFEGLENR